MKFCSSRGYGTKENKTKQNKQKATTKKAKGKKKKENNKKISFTFIRKLRNWI